MKILVVGSGGREHALGWKLSLSASRPSLFFAPGNPGTAALGTNLPIAVDQIAQLADFAAKERIDLTVVGPEVPLTLGIVDLFTARGLRCWGPSKAAAKLEGSKVDMKEFLRRHNIPTANFRIFTKAADAYAHLDDLAGPSVVKCDGLAAGKGVTVAKTVDEAKAAVEAMMVKQVFGAAAGRQIIIEDVLRGEEISVFALCDGRNAVLCDYVQDHKQLRDGDQGPNTGGMGAFTPVPGLVTARDEDDIVRRILVPTMAGLLKEGRPFTGLLYMGIMLTDAGPKILEYNVRFGDPECQALMPRLKNDLVEVLNACIDGTLDRIDLSWDPRTSVCVTLAAGNYPDAPLTGVPINGLDSAQAHAATVFHAGTSSKDGALLTAGGRVLSVCALGSSLDDARATAYAACDAIQFTGKQLRRDIGRRREARAKSPA